MPRKIIYILGIIFTLSLSSFAQPEPDIDCNKKQFDTQLEMNICSGKEAQKAEAKLKKFWAKLIAEQKRTIADAMAENNPKATEHAKRLLENIERSQAAWEEYLKREMDAVGSIWEGGSIRPLQINTTKSSLIKQRIQQLKDHFCQEDEKCDEN